MHGRRSLQQDLSPFIDNINQRKTVLASTKGGERSKPPNNGLGLIASPIFEKSPSPEFLALRSHQAVEKVETVNIDEGGSSSSDESTESEHSRIIARVIGEFARPTFPSSSSAIVLPKEVRDTELKPQHQNLLPTYHGIANEDALTFIREFTSTVQSFPLGNITEDQLKMKCFPLSFKDHAKTWYLTLPANSVSTWNDVCERFMLKYYPNRKTQEIQSQIMNFEQGADELFHDAWERFQELLYQCPHHQVVPEMLRQYFYEGLHQTSQFMVDSTAGGNIALKTADELNEIFETLAASSRLKLVRPRRRQASAVISEDTSSDLRKQIAAMARKMQELEMKTEASPSTPPAKILKNTQPQVSQPDLN